jgi:hypothetical protein
VERAGNPWGDQFVYVVDYQSGDGVLMPGSEEDNINKLGQNIHTPVWVTTDELHKLPFRSDKLKAAVLQGLESGFDSEPKTLA